MYEYEVDGAYTLAELLLLGVPLDLVPADAVMCDRPRCCRLAGWLLPGIALCDVHYDRCHDGETYEIPGRWFEDAPPDRIADYEARLAEFCERRGVARCAMLDRDLNDRIAEAVDDLIVAAGGSP